jgi:hypothetical protein
VDRLRRRHGRRRRRPGASGLRVNAGALLSLRPAPLTGTSHFGGLCLARARPQRFPRLGLRFNRASRSARRGIAAVLSERTNLRRETCSPDGQPQLWLAPYFLSRNNRCPAPHHSPGLGIPPAIGGSASGMDHGRPLSPWMARSWSRHPDRLGPQGRRDDRSGRDRALRGHARTLRDIHDELRALAEHMTLALTGAGAGPALRAAGWSAAARGRPISAAEARARASPQAAPGR